MRLTFIISSFCALATTAQAFPQAKVTMQLGRVTIREALVQFQRQTQKILIFSDDRCEIAQLRDVNYDEVDEETFLQSVLSGSGMSYRITGDYILIVPVDRAAESQQAPIRSLRGTVRDERGTPLAGCAVVIVGADGRIVASGISDAAGNYSVRFAFSEGIRLNFTYVGKKNIDIRYAGQTELNVTMDDTSTDIREVVVTGYGVVDRRMLTSSVSTIKTEELEKIGVLTVDQMLEGKAPGLMVMNLSAQPGAASKIRVRSSGTFTGSREPLWVVDGVIYEGPVPLNAEEINSLDRVSLIGNAISGLNPQDIESVNILKDASATAIYGTRAANGVIVVTTRRGKMGAPSLSYRGAVSFTDRPRYGDFSLMNSKERVDVSRELADRGLVFPTVWPSTTTLRTPLGYEKALQDFWTHGDFERFQRDVSHVETLNYDWFADLYRPSVNHSHSVNIGGGSDNIRYYTSIGYDDQRGTERGVSVNRLTARANLDINLRENMLVIVGMNGSVQKSRYNRTDESVFRDMPHIFNEAYYTSRAVAARDAGGNLIYVDKLAAEVTNNAYKHSYAKYNILHERGNYVNRIDNKEFNVSVGLNWDIVPWIRYSGLASYRNTTNLREEYVTQDTYYMARLRGYGEFSDAIDETLMRVHSTAPFGGLYSGGQISQEKYTLRNQLNIARVVCNRHAFNLNLTQEMNSQTYGGVTKWEAPGYNHDQGRRFISLPQLGSTLGYFENNQYRYEAMMKWFTGEINHSVYPEITEQTTNSLSWLGMFTYSYDNRYIANFNIRSDGSNAFGQYQRYKFRPTWSVSARWNIHQEAFMGDTGVVDELALRGSYGFRGNVPAGVSPYLILTEYGHNNAAYYPETTSSMYSFPNANLRWETTSTVNIGLNYSLFDNRLSGSADYDYSHGKDLLLTRPFSLVNGTALERYNGGSKDSHTFELDIHGRIIRRERFGWNVSLNVTHNRESVISGTNVTAGGITVANYLGINGRNIFMKGFPVDGFYSYRFGGLDENGAPTFTGLYDEFTTDYEKLQAMMAYQGSRVPSCYGGFSTSVRVGELTLTANFAYKLGQRVRLLQLYKDNTYMPLSHQNMRREFVDRWRKPGDATDIPALSADPKTIKGVNEMLLPYGSSTSLYSLYDLSDLRTAKGDFIRCQSLTFSYRCPARWLEASGLKSALLQLQVQNAFVWAFDKKLKGQDPEQISNIGPPTLTSFNLSLNIGF